MPLLLRRALSRRAALRGLGACVPLPWLEAMLPRRLPQDASTSDRAPNRFVGINVSFGFHAPHFFPREEGPDFRTTPTLEPLEGMRGRYTVVEGLDHGISGAHIVAHPSFLSGVDFRSSPAARTQPTLDQVLAGRIGGETRFSSFELGVDLYEPTGRGASVSELGTWIPRMVEPRHVYRAMFETGTKSSPFSQDEARRKESVLDRIRAQARALEATLGSADRDKLDEYFTSIRQLEEDLARQREWATRPLPAAPELEFPNRPDPMFQEALMYRLMALGLQTDSSRVYTLLVVGRDTVMKMEGVTTGYHSLSHHGQQPDKLRQLVLIEREHVRLFAGFLAELEAWREPDGRSLLDRTCVLLGSGLGNGNSHSNRELPLVVAGGGFAHTGSRKYLGERKEPMSNLLLTLLRRLGVERESFGASTGTLTGFS